MSHFEQVNFNLFAEAREFHTEGCKNKGALTPISDLNQEASFYLSYNGKSGFGITEKGELISLYSAEGKGSWTVQEAVKRGACHLDCFDGFLPEFYEQFGFSVTAREPNWTEGGPDVVYMSR